MCPIPHPLPTCIQALPPFIWPSPHYCLYPWAMHLCSLVNSFTFLSPVPHPRLLTYVCLFHVQDTYYNQLLSLVGLLIHCPVSYIRLCSILVSEELLISCPEHQKTREFIHQTCLEHLLYMLGIVLCLEDIIVNRMEMVPFIEMFPVWFG